MDALVEELLTKDVYIVDYLEDRERNLPNEQLRHRIHKVVEKNHEYQKYDTVSI